MLGYILFVFKQSHGHKPSRMCRFRHLGFWVCAYLLIEAIELSKVHLAIHYI
jgi:hypothetical protein